MLSEVVRGSYNTSTTCRWSSLFRVVDALGSRCLRQRRESYAGAAGDWSRCRRGVVHADGLPVRKIAEAIGSSHGTVHLALTAA